MTDEEQNSNERKDPPARKAKTGAWWKSVRRSAEAEEKNETPAQPAPSVAAEAPAAAALPEPDGRPLDPPQATETAAAPPPPARETTPAVAASVEPAGETSDTAAASDEAASGDTPGEDQPPARAKRKSRRGGRKRGKRADSPPAEGTDLPAEEPVVPAAAQEPVDDQADDDDQVPEPEIDEQAKKAVTYKLLINAEEPEECRIALVEDGRLESFHVTTIDREPTKNNIYKGRIVSIEANLQAAFVDIGTGRNGFLPFNEIHPEYFRQDVSDKSRALIAQQQWKKLKIEEVVQKGQEVLVQVVKEVTGNKGANMTTYLSLPGRCLVLMPGSDSAGISRKIVGEERRAGLREIMSEFEIPEGIGYIIRTASAEITRVALENDLQTLLALWEEIKKRGQTMNAPALVYEEQDTVVRFLRDHFFAEIQEILVDTQESLDNVNAFIEQLPPKQRKVKVRMHRASKPIFNQYNIEEQIESIYRPQVTLPSGGSIVIDPTEALVAIDVNSGRTSKNSDFDETIFLANMEAAAELARQLRLRDLGGLIVVDFIDMRNKKHIREVERQVKVSMKRDKAKVDISKISRFGLMQISRQKMGAPIEKGSYLTCPHCQGRGVIRSVETQALYYLRRIQTGITRKKVGRVECRLPLDVAQYLLNKKRAELVELEHRNSARIDIIPCADMKPADHQLDFLEPEAAAR
ncbi:Rne/Rng family ribonuclease [uncultured Desulfobulbus sp.]|uniref:Rne/Rng family ribonuclease n=1 Tax=uncultured Desulfobulbus sp. TaxID=239745 RepID=UPI0026204632|nr:Rne/Rng family ribonuclease [uncultured Desulfobulbus sp.]